ncbi:uncharacterized protein [Palaemon carinicauda]|uniref:uncharacterized protein n=1 Tax=Palaemon carinicauda TaxID=392227 RepID=UPI0035B577AD
MSVNADNDFISDYKTLYDRYASCITDIATREVHRVFKWLYKGGEEYVGDYFKSIDETMFNKLGKDKKKLEERMSTENMDITLLYRLIQHTCDVSPHNANIWHKPHESQTESIEHSLYQLKEKRNELAHEPQKLKKMSDDEMISKINEVNHLSHIILTRAGNKCSMTQDAAVAILDMENRFQKVMGVKATHIAKLGRLEKQAKTQQDMEFYVSPILMYKGDHLQLSDIFTVSQNDDAQRTIIFLRGDAGSGKSTLCQYLDCQWTADKERIQNLQEYELILLFKCRDVWTRDLIMLLRQDLLPDTMKYCDPYKIPELLQDLKILWIIDGLEEATKEATDLIHKLLMDSNSCHTFLLASRPEFIYSITKNLQQHEYTEVTLCGVNPKDLFQSLRTSLQNYTNPSDIDRFTSDFVMLDQNIQLELQNPLKLGIAMKFWNKTDKKPFEDFSLTELYEILAVSQVKSLAEKLTREMVTVGDAFRKVKTWFNYFCETAYDLTTANHILIITNAKLEKLKMKSDELQIPSTLCLSEFLTCSDQGNYQFLHSTQQYYLAAIYAAHVFTSTTDRKQECTTEKNIKYPYEILLHMVSILQDSLDEIQVSNLIQLFESKIDTENATPKWFEVVRNANYNESFLHIIGNVIPECWFISDKNIKAATCLIKHKQPREAIIKLDNNPENSTVIDLLHTIAKSKSRIAIQLYLDYHFRQTEIVDKSDVFIEIICGKTSIFSIFGFSGHLSLKGCKLLDSDNFKKNCRELQLKVSSRESLYAIYYHVRKYKNIARIELAFTFKDYGLTNIRHTTPAFKNITVDLHLHNLLDDEVQKAAKLINKLGQSFNNIIIYKLSKSGAQKFVEFLQNNVRANAFWRNIVNKEKMEISFVNFGPLPLEYNFSIFHKIWVLSEK